MKQRLLEILASPCCRAELRLENAVFAGEEIESGGLRCRCEASYPIRSGIPRFVTDDAYAEPFTWQWHRHGTTQLERGGSRLTEGKLRYKTGLARDELKDALVLDAGIGMGRFADAAERCGAEVVGFDLSGSVDAARKNFDPTRRIHLAQADLYRPPFREGTFDAIYSIGVLQHTPDPRRGVLSLAPLLKPGGSLAVSVYAKAPRYWYMIDLWRRLTTRLSPRGLYRLSKVLALGIYPVISRRPLRPLLLLFPIPQESDPDWRVLNTFNLYGPKYQSKHTYWEVWQWFQEAGLEHLEILPHMVSVRGRRLSDGAKIASMKDGHA